MSRKNLVTFHSMLPGKQMILLTLSLLLTALWGTGCAAGRKDDILHFLRQHEHEVSAIEYRVGIPDTVSISAPRIAEIDRVEQRIQPDGKINLRLLGEVKIVGMTAREIAAKMEVQLSRYYVDPKVSVRVTQYASKKYYMSGQLLNIGPRIYTGRDTLLDAIMYSGVSNISWLSQTKVIRPSPETGEQRIIKIDVDEMIASGDWSKNILLEPDDIVCVPPTPLGWIGLQFRTILYPVQPAITTYQAPGQFMQVQTNYSNGLYSQGQGGAVAAP